MYIRNLNDHGYFSLVEFSNDTLGIVLSIEPEVTSALSLGKTVPIGTTVSTTTKDVKIPMSVVGKMVNYLGESLTDEPVPACTEVISLFNDME